MDFSFHNRLTRKASLLGLSVLMVGVFPWVFLIAFPNATFLADWANHLWMIGYHGEYLRTQVSVAEVFNTREVIGLPFPVFYSYLLYPLLGGVSSFAGPQLAVRIAILAISIAQALNLYRLFYSASKNNRLSIMLSLLGSWALYPLVNIYHRGAVAEYFAGAALSVAACSSLLLSSRGTRSGLILETAIVFVFYSLMVGSHSITALYGSLFLGVLWISLFWNHRIRRSLSLGFGLSFLVLLPWLIPTILFRDKVEIASSLKGGIEFFVGLDTLFLRLLPVAVNPKMFYGEGSVPDFSVPLNLPLFLFCLWFSSSSKGDKRTWGVRLVTGLLFLVSISPGTAKLVNGLVPLKYFQFAYRTVVYLNLSLVFLAFSQLAKAPGSFVGSKRTRMVMIGLVLVSFLGVFSSWRLAAISASESEQKKLPHYNRENRSTLVELSPVFYGRTDYSTPRLFLPLSDQATLRAIPVEEGRGFGKTAPLAFTTQANGEWVTTNVMSFAWNKLILDGVPVPLGELFTKSSFLSLRIPVSGAHTLSYQFDPPRYWRALRYLSFLLWAVGVGILGISLLLKLIGRGWR